jgi:hypothetical protein
LALVAGTARGQGCRLGAGRWRERRDREGVQADEAGGGHEKHGLYMTGTTDPVYDAADAR